MSVFDMLKKSKAKKTEGKQTPPKNKPGEDIPSYSKLELEAKLTKYLVDDDIVQTVLPVFEKLNTDDYGGGLVNTVLEILEFKETEITNLLSDSSKFENESGDYTPDDGSNSDDNDDEDRNLVDEILSKRYSES